MAQKSAPSTTSFQFISATLRASSTDNMYVLFLVTERSNKESFATFSLIHSPPGGHTSPIHCSHQPKLLLPFHGGTARCSITHPTLHLLLCIRGHLGCFWVSTVTERARNMAVCVSSYRLPHFSMAPTGRSAHQSLQAKACPLPVWVTDFHWHATRSRRCCTEAAPPVQWQGQVASTETTRSTRL